MINKNKLITFFFEVYFGIQKLFLELYEIAK